MFLRDVANYIIHFIFLFVALSTTLGIVLMLVGLGVGALLHFALGYSELINSPSAMGGLAVGFSVAVILSFFLSIWGTIKVAPTEASRRSFIAKASTTLGKPHLASELGYGRQDMEPDNDAEDWYTRGRNRERGDEEDYAPRR